MRCKRACASNSLLNARQGGPSALHAAAQHGHVAVAACLLDHGTDLNYASEVRIQWCAAVLSHCGEDKRCVFSHESVGVAIRPHLIAT
ncbi:hypothetical protein [Salmonella enterica]|uniref:hypothetical protein n=1 Tax=Salmonella enterica TaxID=28901 RepID=UPI003526624A